jgi:hypothetical protein
MHLSAASKRVVVPSGHGSHMPAAIARVPTAHGCWLASAPHALVVHTPTADKYCPGKQPPTHKPVWLLKNLSLAQMGSQLMAPSKCVVNLLI